MPRWLLHLGLPGLFFVSIVDSSIIPLPLPGSTDILLLLLVASVDRTRCGWRWRRLQGVLWAAI